MLKEYVSVPREQFFNTDYHSLIRDRFSNVLDEQVLTDYWRYADDKHPPALMKTIVVINQSVIKSYSIQLLTNTLPTPPPSLPLLPLWYLPLTPPD